MIPTFLTPLLLRRLALTVLLAADILYAALFAPKGDPPGNLFVELALGQGPARNPAVWGVFQLLGVVPLMYWALLFPDGRGQRMWAWPFALGMMAFGAFSLLPYLILRRPYTDAGPGAGNLAVRWFGGRAFAIFVALALMALLLILMVWGNLTGYVFWFRHSNFVNVMTVDLLVLTLLFPILLRDDMARRGVADDSTLGLVALGIPLLGPAYYLVRRPAEE
jgi:hypothetical protein